MLELDTARMERNAASGQGAPGAVFQVAADRTPDLRELGPDLVVTSRQQFDLHERVVRTRSERRIAQARLLGIALRGVVSPRTVGLAVAQDIVAQLAALGIGRGLGQRPIDLMDAAFADHFVEPCEGFRCFGENNGPAHGTVDTVHHAKEHLAGFRIAPFDESFDLVFQSAFARRIGLHQVAAALVDDQQVIVLVENIVGSEHRRYYRIKVKGSSREAESSTVAVPWPLMMTRIGEPWRRSTSTITCRHWPQG